METGVEYGRKTGQGTNRYYILYCTSISRRLEIFSSRNRRGAAHSLSPLVLCVSGVDDFVSFPRRTNQLHKGLGGRIGRSKSEI